MYKKLTLMEMKNFRGTTKSTLCDHTGMNKFLKIRKQNELARN
jgi:hypothetical protein